MTPYRLVQSLKEMEGECLTDNWSGCMARLGIVHTVDREKGVITMTSNTEKARFRLTLKVDDQTKEVILVMPLERKCDEIYRVTMAEFCNKCNNRMTSGFFSIDFSDGSIRYRNSCDLNGLEITPLYVDKFIKTAVGYCTKMYSGFQLVLSGFSVERGIQAIEKN